MFITYAYVIKLKQFILAVPIMQFPNMLKLFISFLLLTSTLQRPDNSSEQTEVQGFLDCISELKIAFNEVNDMFSQNTSAEVIQDAVKLTIQIPKLLDICGDTEDAKQFKAAIPQICAKQLGIAANLVLKLFDDSDHKQEFLLDMIVLQSLYQKKLYKDCPFLSETPLQSVPDTESCMNAMVKMDELYNKIVDAYDSSKYELTVDLLAQVLNYLEPALKACGQDYLAQTVSEDLPPKCIKSLQKIGKLLANYEESQSTVQWIFSHLIEMTQAYYQVENQCPIFNDDEAKVPLRVITKHLRTIQVIS